MEGPSHRDDKIVDIDLDFDTRMALYLDAEVHIVIDGTERTPQDAAALCGIPLFIITASNPKSLRFTPEANAAANAELEAVLCDLGVSMWPAVGRDPNPAVGHEEWGFAVVGIDADHALALGAHFGQDAIFIIEGDRIGVAICDDATVVWKPFAR